MGNKFGAVLDNILRLGERIDKIHISHDQPSQDRPVITASPSVGQQEVLHWLDATFTHDEYRSALNARVKGTCSWIIERPIFQKWLDDEQDTILTKFLWVHGYPGFGKTVLAASLIEHLRRFRPVAFFFCFYSDQKKRQPLEICRSWLAQAVTSNEEAFYIAKDGFVEKKSDRALEMDLWTLFRKINMRLRGQIFVVDGFDECTKSEATLARNHDTLDARERFMKNLEEALERTGARVLFTSRENADIRNSYRRNVQFPTSGPSVHWLEYEISRLDTVADIHLCANNVMEQDLKKKSQEVRDELAALLVDKCEGMFLYIRRIQPRLKAHASMAVSKLRLIIEEMPTGLEEAYKRDLLTILELDTEDRERALTILRWVLFATKALTVREISEALLVSTDLEDSLDINFPQNELPEDWDDEYVENRITGLCGSLIELRGGEIQKPITDQTIHFVHFTAQEYLVKGADLGPSALPTSAFRDATRAHELIVQVCLRYLCYDDFKQEDHSSMEQYYAKLKAFAFLEYAGVQWTYHASYCRPFSPELVRLCNELLDPSASRWLSYSEVIGSNANGNFEDFLARFRNSYPNPLFYASLWGLIECMDFLLDGGAEVNIVGGLFGSPLQAASAMGHIEAVRLLLAHGADSNLSDGASRWGFALQAAAGYGQEEILEILLQHKAQVNKTGGEYGTALIAAATVPREEAVACRVIKRLIRAGADVGICAPNGETALHGAASSGTVKVQELLLKNGLDINATCNSGETTLHKAASLGKEKAAKYLLEHGADHDIGNFDQRTPLHYAAEGGHDSIVQLLIAWGAKVDSRSKDDSWTPLHCAADEGHSAALESLLQSGSDLDACGSHLRTPLQLAAEQGHVRCVQVLLDHRPDLERASDDGRTALHWAASDGHGPVVELLLQSGAEIEAADGMGFTALHWAARYKFHSVTSFLLNRGANVNATTHIGSTPLHIAVNDAEFVKLLLYHDAAIDQVDIDDRTPLFFAATQGHRTSAKLLVDAGADINKRGPMGQTPLCKALLNRHVGLMELLMAEGSDPALRDAYGRHCFDWISLSHWEVPLPIPSRYVRKNPTVVTEKLSASVVTAVAKIKGINHPERRIVQHQQRRWFKRLGHILCLQGNHEDACTSFEQFLIETSDMPDPKGSCTQCGLCETRWTWAHRLDDRYVCRSCTDVALCPSCMVRYMNDEAVETTSFEVCDGHEFLKIPGHGWLELPEGKVNITGETRIEWLDRLARTYDGSRQNRVSEF